MHHFHHFEEHVRDALIAKLAAKQRVRLWSSAASTGEEVYSIAITLAEEHAHLGNDVQILASDLDTNVLARYYVASPDAPSRQQSVLAVAVFLAAMALFALVLRQYLRRDLGRRKSGRARLLLAAQLALLGFLPLLALRVLSWHQTDRLLYDGPVRLNWILELGLALVPMVAAALYVRHSLRQQQHDRARRRAEEFGRHG
mgnify:CR=1 FL=1